MNDRILSRDEAASLLVNLLIIQARDASVRAASQVLQQGPPGRVKQNNHVVLHNWFMSLSECDRMKVLEVAEYAATTAMFQALVVLDDCAAGIEHDSEQYEIAVYLQPRSLQAGKDPANPRAVRVNPSHQAVELLHDIFQTRVRQEQQKST